QITARRRLLIVTGDDILEEIRLVPHRYTIRECSDESFVEFETFYNAQESEEQHDNSTNTYDSATRLATTESVRVDQLNNVVADEGRLAERDELYYARDMTPNATATEQDRDDD
ncbi:MAG: hypothetical protein ACKPKO_61995, partial [Candidatus Fonsibacter sp.]